MTEQFSASPGQLAQIVTESAKKSIDHYQNMGHPTSLTPEMVRGVSHYRRAQLEEQFNGRGGNVSVMGNVIGHSEGKLNKIATTSAGANWRGSGGSVGQASELYSPLWLTSNLNLPRDRATINAWSRAYFATYGLVQNAISLHSTYPISKLTIKCSNAKVEKFFSEMIEEVELMNVCCQIAQEFWILGEAIVYAELDESSAKWSRLLIQNPDYVTIDQSVVAGEPIISLRPDENLKRIVSGNSPADRMQRQKLDKGIIEHVRRGENIPLPNFYCSHLARRTSPYETRGTGLIVSSFRQLMLLDQLRECKYAQASSMINPLTLIKIGGGVGDYKPTPQDLEAWRDTFEQAANDRNFKIITHEAVTVEPIGFGAGIFDTSADITQLIKEVYMGLMVPSVLMDGGADTSYANGTVALDVLRQRYLQFRNMLSQWLRRKIFSPIAKINDFYDYVDGKKTLIIPEVDWNHMSLFDMDTYISVLVQLTDPSKKQVSNQTLYRSLGLDYEDETRKIRQENIDQVIFEKEKEALAQMSLNDLRALGPDDEIQEPLASPLPGEQATPGETPAPPEMGGMPEEAPVSPIPPPPAG